jgi:hypothetical protein
MREAAQLKRNSCLIDERDSGGIHRVSWDLCEHSIYISLIVQIHTKTTNNRKIKFQSFRKSPAHASPPSHSQAFPQPPSSP